MSRVLCRGGRDKSAEAYKSDQSPKTIFLEKKCFNTSFLYEVAIWFCVASIKAATWADATLVVFSTDAVLKHTPTKFIIWFKLFVHTVTRRGIAFALT